MNKLLIALLCTSIANQAYAQSGTSRLETSPPAKGPVGFYVGAEYMNLTDQKFEVKSYHKDKEVYSDKSSGGMHAGMAGIRVGFEKTYQNNFGINVGSRFIETFNRSEWGDQKVYFIIPEGNLTYSFGNHFLIYSGLNVSFLSAGSTSKKYYKPNAGIQGGFGIHFTESISLNAGYTILRQTLENTEGDYKIKGEASFAGFNSNLNYTF